MLGKWLNAEEAKALAFRNSKHAEEMDSIMKGIREAAERGDLSVVVGNMLNVTQQKLQSLGYTVQTEKTASILYSVYKISWK